MRGERFSTTTAKINEEKEPDYGRLDSTPSNEISITIALTFDFVNIFHRPIWPIRRNFPSCVRIHAPAIGESFRLNLSDKSSQGCVNKRVNT